MQSYSDRLVIVQLSIRHSRLQRSWSRTQNARIYFGQLEWDETNNVDKLLEDLSILLEMAYKSRKPRLEQTFEDEDILMEHPEIWRRFLRIIHWRLNRPKHHHREQDSQKSSGQVDKKIDYQMSLGVVCLSLIHNSNCSQIISVAYEIDYGMFSSDGERV